MQNIVREFLEFWGIIIAVAALLISGLFFWPIYLILLAMVAIYAIYKIAWFLVMVVVYAIYKIAWFLVYLPFKIIEFIINR